MTNTEAMRFRGALETARQKLVCEIQAQTAELVTRDDEHGPDVEHDPIDKAQNLNQRIEAATRLDRLSGTLADIDESLRAISNSCYGLAAESGEPVALKQLEIRLIKEHRAFYEVLPYYVVIEEGHGTPTATTQTIQAGFDIDIYGTRTDNEVGPPPDYAFAYAVLQHIAETISHNTTNSCSIETIPFPSNIFLDTRNQLEQQAMLRIRVSHCRGLDQPAGQAEQRAFEEIEKQLQTRGIKRRSGIRLCSAQVRVD